jgi:hypothetical protein
MLMAPVSTSSSSKVRRNLKDVWLRKLGGSVVPSPRTLNRERLSKRGGSARN